MGGTLLIVRTLFVITIASVSYQLTTIIFNRPPYDLVNMTAIVSGAFVAIFLIWIEIKYTTRFLVGIFTVILGLLIGFIASNLFLQALFLIPHIRILKDHYSGDIEKFTQVQEAIRVGITFLFCYFAVAILYTTQNRFKLLIPFVEFTSESPERYIILDSSVIIDGRIDEIWDTNILNGTLVIAKFILDEIQTLADSPDKQKRMRGRRGLEMLSELQHKKKVKVSLNSETFPKIHDVDSKLVALAKKLGGILITNDYNLEKIAQLHEIDIVNINALANAVRPKVFPGKVIDVQVVKQGEEPNQGLAYLDDGTVVVVDNGRKYINEKISVAVTNVLQNNIGRMVFAKLVE